MFLHSYFYPIHRFPGEGRRETALLCFFTSGVLLGSLLAAPFSDPGGCKLALALLSSPRSAGGCVLLLILPLLAGSLLLLLRSPLPALALLLVLGIPLGYTVFFFLRFLGERGSEAALLLLGPNLAALPGLFWFLSRGPYERTTNLLPDLTLACALCLVPGLAAESVLAPLLRQLANTITM